ncbi:MAG: AAA family ATPase [Isosphaeraceae bacterium]
MPTKISRFYVEALHGAWSVDVPIEDNKLILVGENGSGKTTIANLLFYFLSCQWGRLAGYNFESLKLTVSDEEITLKKDDLAFVRQMAPRFWRHFGPEKSTMLLTALSKKEPFEFLHSREMFHLTEELRMSPSMLQEIILSGKHAPESLAEIAKINERLNTIFQDQILYLPTYRRIEHDLSSIFPEIEEEIRKHQERSRRQHAHRHHNYIELVEFGMKDVDTLISEKMGELKDHWRTGLSKLTGTYLREVIRGAYTVDINRIKAIPPEAVDLMLSRIEEQILPVQEKAKVRSTVGEIKSKTSITTQENVVAHFLHKLIELHEDQQLKEKKIRNFVAVCNDYFPDKSIVFDNVNFTISIRARNRTTLVKGQAKPKKKHEPQSSELTMQMLSSGEKQIVSLFSHIFLSGHTGYIVLIDEPELSLSVPWQKKFLVDILRTGYCSALFAVTHSPFIYENELDNYARSVEEFRRALNEVR